MKKRYSVIITAALMLSQAEAQIIPQMDLIKSPQYSFESPVMELVMKSGAGLAEEKIGASWRNDNRFTGIQDANGNQTLFESEFWDTVGNKWVQEVKMVQTITYNPSNKPLTNYFVMFQEGTKLMAKSQTFSYDGSGKYLPVISKDTVFNPTPLLIVNIDSMVYDANGRIEQRVFARSFMGLYGVTSRYKFSYNASGNLIEMIEQDYSTSTQGWENLIRRTYSYTGAGKIQSLLEQEFVNPNWTNSDLDSFLYDGTGKLVSMVNYSPNGTAWIGDDREDYSYTGSNITQIININWIGGVWVNEKKMILTYSGANLATGLEYMWGGTSWSTEATTRVTWTGGSTGLASTSKTQLEFYPNPANEQITILGFDAECNVTIRDLQGKACITGSIGSLNPTIGINELEQGIYIISLQSGDKVFSSRFVKQ